MFAAVYLEVNIICLLIAGYVFAANTRRLEQRADTALFNRAVISLIIILVVDSLWAVNEFGVLDTPIWLNQFFGCWYLFQLCLVSYNWVEYVEFKLSGDKRVPLLLHTWGALPLIVMLVLALASLGTGWLCYYDAQGVYQRGPLHFVQVLVCYGYLVFSGIRVFHHYLRSRTLQHHDELLALLSFYPLPFFGGILSALFYGLPSLMPGITLSILLVYINFQRFQISTDSLTGLNNRRQFDRHIVSAIDSMKDNEMIFLILVEVSSTERLSGPEGRVLSDDMIETTADILRKVCGQARNVFLSRFSTSSFALIYRASSEQDAVMIEEMAREECVRHNNNHETEPPVKLKMAHGSIQADSTVSASEIIDSVRSKLSEAAVEA